MTIERDTRLAPAPDLVETELPAELILMDCATQEMFSLNPSGRLVWRALQNGPVAHAITAVAEHFRIAPDRAAADVNTLVADLIHAGLLHQTDSASE